MGNNERIIDYVSKNPFISLWSIAAIVGGIFGYLHYANLGYLPEIDIKSAGTVLLSLALTGIALTICLGIIFLIPTLFLYSPNETSSNSRKDNDLPDGPLVLKKKKRNWKILSTLLRSTMIAVGFLLIIIHIDARRYDPSGFETLNILGIAFVFVFSILYNLFEIINLFEVIKNSRTYQATVIRFNPQISWIKSCLKRYLDSGFHKYCVSKIFSVLLTQNFKLIAPSFIWFFSFCTIYVLVSGEVLSDKSSTGVGKSLWFVAMLMAVIVPNVVLSLNSNIEGEKIALSIKLFLVTFPLLVLHLLPNNKINLEKIIFRQLGLGNLPNTVFFVNSQACETANYIRKNTCTLIDVPKATNESKDDKRIGCIQPHFLENRLGTEYLLAFNDAVAETDKSKPSAPDVTMIPIAKKDVVQWAFLKSKADHNLSCPSPKKT